MIESRVAREAIDNFENIVNFRCNVMDNIYVNEFKRAV